MTRYTVRFPHPHTHYMEIEARFETGCAPTVEAFLPVWTPGSYLVREFARHVEAVAVRDAAGKPLPCVKSRRNRWKIETGGASEIVFEYRVYCREMSVRTNWVEADFALINGAPSFITLVDGMARPHLVRLALPPEWKASVTGLPADGDAHQFIAPNYDTLVDSPIVCGNPAVYRFHVDDIPHEIANEGECGVWDGARAAADVERIVRHFRGMWGSLPYTRYVFLNLITEARGGLEHANSVCMMTNRWATGTRRDYLSWLNLASHEFFHVWNVKRLRPQELGPFDYENENHTTSLWVAEGLTDYYGPLGLRRAGISTVEEYLDGSLSHTVRALQTTPGRQVQSVALASWDAWIKLYRPDENSVNTTISYYTKGAAVGWLLDARIRRATAGAKSLDDLMRLAFARFAGTRGYTPAEFRTAAEEIAGEPLDEFFRRTVDSTDELDYAEALAWFGLRFRAPAPPAVAKGWMGAETKNQSGRLVVRKVLRGTPAYDAGLNVDDEILAMGEFRVHADRLAERLDAYAPGERVSILIARRERLMRIELTLGAEPGDRWQLEIDPRSTPEQTQQRRSWLWE